MVYMFLGCWQCFVENSQFNCKELKNYLCYVMLSSIPKAWALRKWAWLRVSHDIIHNSFSHFLMHRQSVIIPLRWKIGKHLPLGKRWVKWNLFFLIKTGKWNMNLHSWRYKVCFCYFPMLYFMFSFPLSHFFPPSNCTCRFMNTESNLS